MAHEKLTDRNELTTAEDGDKMHIVDVSDNGTDAAGNSKFITVTNLMDKAPVQTVNGADGTVVLDIEDLNNVTTATPSNGNVLNWQTNQWVLDTRLTTLYSSIKEGSTLTLTDGANTNSEMELTGTTAKLKTGITELKLTETSPGDIEFIVATDSSGSTAFTAVHLDGTTTANQADFIVKQGTSLAIEGTSSATAKFRNTNSGNTLITVPASSGTMALTSDITAAAVDSVNGATGTVVLDTDDISEGSSNIYYTEARVSANSSVAANTAKTTFPGFGTTAGTALEGDTTTITTAQANAITANTAKNTYPSADATKLSGIEANADVTDTANVTAAGALMDSEVTNLAQVKAFDSSDYATEAQGTTADSALQDVVDDTAPQLGGDLDTNSKNIVFAKTGNTDHSSNGDIIKFGTGSTTRGEVCYLSAAGTWIATNADDPSTSGACLLAIALGTDPDSDGMLLRGMYTLDHDPGTIGDELYLSASTAGDVTATAPSATGDVVRVIGYCLDSTNGQIWFNPSNDFIELA